MPLLANQAQKQMPGKGKAKNEHLKKVKSPYHNGIGKPASKLVKEEVPISKSGLQSRQGREIVRSSHAGRQLQVEQIKS